MDNHPEQKVSYDAMRDACAYVDMKGSLLRFNEAFRILVGYEQEELLSKTYFDLTPEKWHVMEEEIVQTQVKVQGYSDIYEKEYRRKDGVVVPVELLTTLIRDRHGNGYEMMAIVRDISARVQLQQELSRSREDFRTLAENSPDIVIRFNRSLCHIYVNSAAARTVNLTPEELTGRGLLETGLSYALVDLWHRRIGSVFDSGVAAQLEDVMPTANGPRHIDYHLVPEFGSDGIVSSVLVLGRDITERKVAEEALLLAQECLEQKIDERTQRLQTALREQESFSYSVSHDLRAPLRHINSYLAILAEDYADLLPPEALSLIDRSRSASRGMSKLIDELLELSRVSRANMTKQTVDLSRMVTQISQSLAETDSGRTVEFVIREGIKVRGDKLLLVQMFRNLLENAWKYTGRNPEARIEFGREFVNGQEALYIRDNGVGFDMAYSPLLFRPFQRLHGVEFEGNGIGLATVERIVNRHRGRIWASSEPGIGSTFYFVLS